MNRAALVDMLCEIMALLEVKEGRDFVQNFVDGYLDKGWIDMGFDGLIENQKFINIAMVIIDKIRPLLTNNWNSEALKAEIDRLGSLRDPYAHIVRDLALLILSAYQEGAIASVKERS
jgi:hypothetical protein